MGRKVGQAHKLTPEVRYSVLEYIEDGVPLKFAAERCGVSEGSLHNWIEKGMRNEHPLYVEFLQDIERARAEAVARDIKVLNEHSPRSWQAAAWKLERNHPSHFGKTLTTNAPPSNVPNPVNPDAVALADLDLSPEALREILAAYRSRKRQSLPVPPATQVLDAPQALPAPEGASQEEG